MATKDTKPRFVKCSVQRRVWGISESTQRRYELADPTFPKRIKLGPALFVYDTEHVARFEGAKIAQARGADEQAPR